MLKIKLFNQKSQRPTPTKSFQAVNFECSRQGGDHVRSQSYIPLSNKLINDEGKGEHLDKSTKKKRVVVVRKVMHRDGSSSVVREKMPRGFTVSKTLETLESHRSSQ